MTNPVALYRLEGPGGRYWCVWQYNGIVTLQRGIAGLTTEHEDLDLSDDEALENIVNEEAQELIDQGFVERSYDRPALLIVQYPAHYFPTSETVLSTVDEVKELLVRSLDETGTGLFLGWDYSSEMTFMAYVVDAASAVDTVRLALEEAGKLRAARIGLEEEDETRRTVWPSSEAGTVIH